MDKFPTNNLEEQLQWFRSTRSSSTASQKEAENETRPVPSFRPGVAVAFQPAILPTPAAPNVHARQSFTPMAPNSFARSNSTAEAARPSFNTPQITSHGQPMARSNSGGTVETFARQKTTVGSFGSAISTVPTRFKATRTTEGAPPNRPKRKSDSFAVEDDDLASMTTPSSPEETRKRQRTSPAPVEGPWESGDDEFFGVDDDDMLNAQMLEDFESRGRSDTRARRSF
ncbi:uncharacterized protein EV422DRAFT_95074 [Fimicolochytrium jonesii]|uniref:uncharacterized protein n=1 Tax=Fimicolochytrium jonesii TaxID=1396493 RepID=UPI0022FF09D0|nr:uncharacterized protein EV422DRAFT_95074 [Fimicolochytrium jonesii]KAI8819998.1 hypothetical protein EV422DRAFT_95074 [Fimicolochytrium jonesii]